MKKIFYILKLSLLIGFFSYVIDLNTYYVYSRHDYLEILFIEKKLFVLGTLNVISFIFLIKHLEKGLRTSWTFVFIALLIVSSIGAYTITYTSGDPIYRWLRNLLGSSKYTLITYSVLSLLLVFDKNLLKEMLKEVVSKEEEYYELEDNILDVQLKEK